MPKWTRPNRLLQVQRRTDAKDEDGGSLDRWETFRQLYGRIFPLRAEERVQAGAVEGVRTHEIHIRHDPALTHEHRLVDGSKVYHVDGVVDVDGRGRYAKALVVEVV